MKKLILLAVLVVTHTVLGQTKKRTKVERLPLSNEVYFNSSQCEQSYYSIKLAGFDIGLKNDKNWWAKYEPVLFIEIETDDQKFYRIFGAEVGTIPEDKKKDNGFRTSQNILLIGPYPFKGDNSVKIKARLFATKIEDNIQNVIGAITPITTLIGGQAEMFSKLTTEVANHISGLLSDYRPLVSFEGEWNPYTGNKNDKSIFRSGHYIIHAVEDESKFAYENINISSDGQIEYFEKGMKTYLFQKNVDYAILEFEHQLYRTDISTSKFSYYAHLQDALKESAGDRDSIKTAILFNKFRQNLLEDRSFTNHDKVRILLESDLSIVSQFRSKYPRYVSTNLITPFCTAGLYKSLTPQKLLSEMQIRKSLIENNVILPGQPLVTKYGTLIGNLPNSTKAEVANKLNNIGIEVDKNSLSSIESILAKIEEPIINAKSSELLIKETTLQLETDHPSQLNTLEKQQIQDKIAEVQGQQKILQNVK